MRNYNTPDRLASMLRRVKLIAATSQGKCLAKSYVHVAMSLPFECSIHGRFLAKPKHILAGHWCRKCRDDNRKAEPERRLIEYIEQRGGTLLTEYQSARKHVLINCDLHGPWKATPVNLLSRGCWCARCARSKPRGKRTTNRINAPILI